MPASIVATRLCIIVVTTTSTHRGATSATVVDEIVFKGPQNADLFEVQRKLLKDILVVGEVAVVFAFADPEGLQREQSVP